MTRLTCAVTLTIVPLLLAACSDPGRPTDPLAAGPTAARAARDGAGTAGSGPVRLVNMMDACDPATFNAVLGPGSCTRQGGVSFDEFIAQLQRHQAVGAWHFAPPTLEVRLGQTIVAPNRGGEVHTFTRVAAFGGGIVPLLNQLSGTPTVAPECTRLEPEDFVPPGGIFTEAIDTDGTLEFQCCIHPWMRTIVHVKHS